jgi:outer membrane murein-binding lipoprotein Lpp
MQVASQGKEADMANIWQTMEEAALTLGVSSRTLHRRITKGEVETRLQNGRREVLVDVPAPLSAAADPTSAQPGVPVSDTPAGPAWTDEAQPAILALHEDRIRRTDLAIVAYQQSVTVAAMEARRWRTGARIAWSVAGAAVIALFLTVIWSTHRLTAASAQVENLSGQVQTLATRTHTQSTAAEHFRQQAEKAQVDAARAQGELAAERHRADQRLTASPATQPAPSNLSAAWPTGLLDRLAGIMRNQEH